MCRCHAAKNWQALPAENMPMALDRIRIRINGDPAETPEGTRLRDLTVQPDGTHTGLIRILNGYQTEDNPLLREGDQVVLVPRGVYPPPRALKAMLAARNTPGLADRLARARVGIAGLGGLGSHVATALARTGVGHLHLVDFDVVEPSNLNRQAYRLAHLGLPKTEALRREIADIAPYCEVTADQVRIDAANAPRLFASDDIVCEAFDDPAAKAMLADAVLGSLPRTPLVAASGMAGYASGNTLVTRKITDRFYLCGDGESEAGYGVGLMAPRVMLCAGHQALMILRLIAGETDA